MVEFKVSSWYVKTSYSPLIFHMLWMGIHIGRWWNASRSHSHIEVRRRVVAGTLIAQRDATSAWTCAPIRALTSVAMRATFDVQVDGARDLGLLLSLSTLGCCTPPD
mmetsp:Transcript_33548/g.52203  ORF Transcript_33548/g.52203 Transcript_33548/m.52203 type:complete len:107 (+) Transcript_33548:1033-1353(+)